jgi:hypothetical protein
MAAVGDEDVGEGVGSGGHSGDRLFVGMPRQGQLDHTDGVAATGHRHRQVHAVLERAHVDSLGAQHAFVHGARQRQGLALLVAMAARAGLTGCRRAEADQGTAAEVRDQEPDRLGPDRGRELVGDHVDGLGGGSGLDPFKQRVKIGFRAVAIAHARNITGDSRA